MPLDRSAYEEEDLPSLDTTLRKILKTKIIGARKAAEGGARSAIKDQANDEDLGKRVLDNLDALDRGGKLRVLDLSVW